MILDHISNFQIYKSLHTDFEIAFNYLRNTNFNSLDNGKYPIHSDKCFAIVNRYETKSASESFAESHKRYIDIQYIAQGKEKIGIGHLQNFKQIFFDQESDLLKHEGKLDFITLNEKHFAIFYPDDIHMPGITDKNSEEVLKVVIKIEIKAES